MGETLKDDERGPSDATLDTGDEWLREVAFAPAVAPRVMAPLSGARESVGIGDSIGPYALIRELGRGGMGVVYEGVHRTIAQHIAIKVLYRDSSIGDDALRRFANEARAASSVRHPSVVQVFDFALLPDGAAYILMELVEGELLRDHLARTGRLTCAETTRLGRHVASALASVHAQGIAHRDLKPENVMLARDDPADGGGRAKILDFGIAHLGDEGERITREGRVLGTPTYMAPEQCEGQPSPDGACDIYALGVMMFECLVGEPPFRGSGAAVLRQHMASPAPLWQLPASVPGSLRGLLERMLDKAPLGRPAADELVRELRAIDESPSTGPEPRVSQSLAETLPSIAPTEFRTPRRAPIRTRHWLLAAGLSGVVGGSLIVYLAASPRPPHSLSGMQWLPGGQFGQGRSLEEIDRECTWLGKSCRRSTLEAEQPPRNVTVSPFYLDLHEVTNQDYARMLNATPSAFRVDHDADFKGPRYVRLVATNRLLLDLWHPGSGIVWDGKVFAVRPGFANLPVVQVTWDGASFYCRTRAKRLPSEAEWEFAARGAGNRRFAWGNELPTCDSAVYGRDKGEPCDGRPRAPSAVGTTPRDRTPEGITDLGGNVMEWVDDAARLPYYQPCGDCRDPRVQWEGPLEEDFRVLRGAGWSNTVFMHSSARGRWKRAASADDLGFRCATSDER